MSYSLLYVCVFTSPSKTTSLPSQLLSSWFLLRAVILELIKLRREGTGVAEGGTPSHTHFSHSQGSGVDLSSLVFCFHIPGLPVKVSSLKNRPGGFQTSTPVLLILGVFAKNFLLSESVVLQMRCSKSVILHLLAEMLIFCLFLTFI